MGFFTAGLIGTLIYVRCGMSSEPRSNVPEITLVMIRESLGSAVLCDALDAEGFRHQSPPVALRPMTTAGVLVGRCRTTLWADMRTRIPALMSWSLPPSMAAGRATS